MRQLPQQGYVPKLRRMPVYAYGPRELRLREEPRRNLGPGEPPPGFIRATTSKSEWWMYWALAKIFNDPAEPRRPPFYGGQKWGFQLAINGGRQVPGGAVVDFIVYLEGETIGLRLQTPYFHYLTSPLKQFLDEKQAGGLSRYMTVRDVFEVDILEDQSGSGAIRTIVGVLGGRERINPATAGTGRQTRS